MADGAGGFTLICGGPNPYGDPVEKWIEWRDELVAMNRPNDWGVQMAVRDANHMIEALCRERRQPTP